MAIGKICCICGNSPAYNYKKSGIYYCDVHRKEFETLGYIRSRTIRTKNEIIRCEDHAEIVLYNKECKEIARALIDLEDIEMVCEYKWRFTHGYVCNRMSGVALQNLIMNFSPNKELVVDHINRNRLDCRKSNLRMVTYTVNGFNKGTQSNNTSGFPGVVYLKKSDNWRTAIKINKKVIYVGVYETKEEAILARIEAELKYFGEIINRDNDCNTVFKKDKQ